jgi:hypothetical protein
LIKMGGGMVGYMLFSNQVFHPHRCCRWSVVDEVKPSSYRLDLAIDVVGCGPGPP